MDKSQFPQDFLWGASTAAHQVEGGTYNQWSEWEKANAERLASTAPQRLSWLPNWPRIELEATQPENYISGKAVEHYTRYKEDFQLLKQLNLKAFRFSIEWSRIEPVEGQWDEEAIQHYHAYIAELKRQNIEPILTLWHWTIPVWFAAKRGFERRTNLRYFARFVQKVMQEYGASVRYVLTLNEPNNYATIGYILGEWPPQQRNPMQFLRVYTNLTRAHRQAYAIIKQTQPTIQVGVAMHMVNSQPSNPQNLISRIFAGVVNYAWNRWFLNRIRQQQDFIGINYYITDYYKNFQKSNPRTPLNDMGWYMEPSSLDKVLQSAWRHYRLPLMITENGLADAADMHRKWWIEETIPALQRAQTNGVKVLGYLHWSLLDNFEWNAGWWPKFGLIAVDRRSMHRTIRPSARWFGRWLKKQH